jgi:hypothetical protein
VPRRDTPREACPPTSLRRPHLDQHKPATSTACPTTTRPSRSNPNEPRNAHIKHLAARSGLESNGHSLAPAAIQTPRSRIACKALATAGDAR